ncbi:F-box/kelch-repeat protein At3g06240-like [Macadamia integrifolia]|uniref:F-box/kelch-repeat protein At3g06240-like n=1 Tax=Macadamia integrifolia TaxID=60698 RepID=UPI001C500D82|nr:F-box/kelch-repeat protein At3g06240-like [Macadamia integrifolia]XP_042498751.1 F-box/kelch-repeat protein At3g06240-like [Macadamia integrifolia]XP_042498752.1 F-box/kelch-repeat protein At3g06240-like [Macadamia integrifolia]XP_042498753.1 F-box/kelch-repeat protein At3g06240-like [Macadamia integrifolia]
MEEQRKEKKERREEETRMSARTESPNLPNEIKDEIFLNLPVTSLLRFRCVIRDYSRFYSPNFIKMHLNRQIEKDNGSTIIVSTVSKIYKVNIDEFRSPIQLDFPHRNPTCLTPIVVVGSCNGLLCLTHRGLYEDTVYVWNPATGDYMQLPEHINNGSLYIRMFGFGYDHVSGKFKVLAISHLAEKRPGLRKVEASVYTMGTSSWRSIGEIQYPRWDPKPQVFGGCPHWVVPPLKSVVSFNVGDEKFKEIPLPPVYNSAKTANLTSMGGCLSMFCCQTFPDRYELWVKVDDVSGNTAWTKQLSLNVTNIPGDSCMFGLREIKLYGFKNGRVLLRHDGPALFDPVSSDVRSLHLPGAQKEFNVYSYIESLAMVTFE